MRLSIFRERGYILLEPTSHSLSWLITLCLNSGQDSGVPQTSLQEACQGYLADKVMLCQGYLADKVIKCQGYLADKVMLCQGYLADKVMLCQGYLADKVMLCQGYLADKVTADVVACQARGAAGK